MNNKIKNIIITINYTFLTAAMIVCSFLNIENSIQIIFLYFIALTSYTIRTFLIYNSYENKEKWRKIIYIYLTYILEIFILLILQKYDVYLVSFIIILIIIEDIVLNESFKVSLISTILIYIITFFILYIKFINDLPKALINTIILFPIFLTIYIIFYLIYYLLKQNSIINNSLKEITISNIEKDNLYKDLKEAYNKVEAITALRERNRMAAEIHDTVGHTLTTVLVELEASKRLMNKDLSKALEKLNLAQGQVREGLNSIRSSVRIIEKGEAILDFPECLEALIANTQKHSEVIIEKYININKDISGDVQNIVYSALMEGLTNGIRHGKCTAFIFKLYNDEANIYFSLEDNGIGTSVISFGFGLRAMKSKIIEHGGKIEAESKKGYGFKIYITLPL